MDDSKQGPLTIDELEDIWIAAVDPSYSSPFLAVRDAGEEGFEPYQQGFVQFARVSTAIDVSTQAMYILPWSGQTNMQARGEAKALVTLTLARTLHQELPLRIGAGQVFFEEQTTDWGENEGIVVETGRRYTLTADAILMPGDKGPLSMVAIAEAVGWGYNNPLPGTIRFVDQIGSHFFHDRATVTVVTGTPAPAAVPTNPMIVTLTTVNEADTFIPEHVGQYVEFTSGANAGTIARIISFTAPNPTAVPPTGSAVGLETLGTFESINVLVPGTFVVGEMIKFVFGITPVGYGSFVSSATLPNGHTRIAYILLSGVPFPANTATGMTSGTSVSTDVSLTSPVFIPEAPPGGGGPGGASWRVLDWVTDLGLTSTNVLRPLGGRLGMLDAIGYERDLPRLTSELDDDYAQRMWQVSDVVTPNAIRRALNRVGPGPWCLREAGTALLPGFFFDRIDAGGDFYDYDVLQFTVAMAPPLPIVPDFFQEPVEIRDAAGLVKVSGYVGRLDVGGVFTMIRKKGQGTLRVPFSIVAGDVLVGLVGGWSTPLDISQPFNPVGLPQDKRFQFYLDYEQFRGFMLIGAPRRETGEFGFCYDQHPFNAYDLPAPYRTFYDGMAMGADDAAFYKRAWQAVDKVRAGGVGFELYVEDGTCT